MAVEMRLRRMEQKKAPFCRIIVADFRSPRDDKFIAEIGTYDPARGPSVIKFDGGAVKRWLTTGTQPAETVGRLLRIAGIQQLMMKY